MVERQRRNVTPSYTQRYVLTPRRQACSAFNESMPRRTERSISMQSDQSYQLFTTPNQFARPPCVLQSRYGRTTNLEGQGDGALALASSTAGQRFLPLLGRQLRLLPAIFTLWVSPV